MRAANVPFFLVASVVSSSPPLHYLFLDINKACLRYSIRVQFIRIWIYATSPSMLLKAPEPTNYHGFRLCKASFTEDASDLYAGNLNLATWIKVLVTYLKERWPIMDTVCWHSGKDEIEWLHSFCEAPARLNVCHLQLTTNRSIWGLLGGLRSMPRTHASGCWVAASIVHAPDPQPIPSNDLTLGATGAR